MKYLLALLLLMVACAPRKEIVILPPPTPIAKPIPAPTLPPPPVMTPISKGLIIIDPGHGGDDLGTQSNSDPKYLEKHLNLATAQQLRTFLNQMGYATSMTRTKDIFISLDKRAQFANDRSPLLFVSVHYNSAPSPDAEGVEVFYYRADKDPERTKQSKALAQSVLAKIIAESKARSRGVKHGNFAVIRQTTMPAILVEGGFLTNDREMERIKDPSYVKKLAWAMAKGVDEYLGQLQIASP